MKFWTSTREWRVRFEEDRVLNVRFNEGYVYARLEKRRPGGKWKWVSYRDASGEKTYGRLIPEKESTQEVANHLLKYRKLPEDFVPSATTKVFYGKED